MQELQRNPILGITAAPAPPGTNPYEWVGNIAGPPDSPYEGGLFVVRIHFPNDYPFSPPHITMQTRIHHPNISPDGRICLDTLSRRWSSALTIGQVLLSIQQLMGEPNPHNPLAILPVNRQQFNQTARQWTQLYARPPQPHNQSTQGNRDNSGNDGSGGSGGTGSQ
ncbi:unnamed protein product [Oppiella nova]|uniref:UBC core domain-containing protein n=1 Tax=Oppiella nova TaxID=334625 RepID=A0A7R9MJZ3_9ACAR|nr:unnamed protein product [Oppiella nova]CAG2178687.1 unnamed protein product [Oppiella nova]